ncbi:MAG: phosphoenolpyruvate carboxylase [Crocinitomicaceae bacterium]|nr:phosphoenolpyruvate carboxylase [Crocinitomicaceae bacterium]
MATSADHKKLQDMLRAFADNGKSDPQTNSVFSLARQIFDQINMSGEPDYNGLTNVIDDIHLVTASNRAASIARQHGIDDTANQSWPTLLAKLDELSDESFEVFRDFVDAPKGGIVFTAHPTFSHPANLRSAIAGLATNNDEAAQQSLKDALQHDSRLWEDQITLYSEHDEAQSAIRRGNEGLRDFVQAMLDVARIKFPDRWTQLRPKIPTLASWTGYDLDGRTDIHWSQSVALRLSEKASQLSLYCARLDADIFNGIDAARALRSDLQRAADLTRKEADAFNCDSENQDQFTAAVGLLTETNPDRILCLESTIARVDALVEATDLADDARAAALCLRTEMSTFQLGTAHIHLRVNAAQVRAVIKRDMGFEMNDASLGREVLNSLAEKAAEPVKKQPSFIDLMREQATARRQVILCYQILNHIDKGAPIRFLIAESENPAIVMGVLSLAREYGIDASLDISPLFETPDALESGGRFMQRLLREAEFQAYVKQRGRLSVQLGFSDAGRFIGQLAADIAIERIHNLILRELNAFDDDIDFLIFNTHGESMGRGAWPESFQDRFNHLLTPWIRNNARESGRRILHEVSFQGGDGYLHFANEVLARSTCAHFILSNIPDSAPEDTDDFYTRQDFIWDFYRGLRRWHEDLFENQDYGRLLSGFPASFLVKAGSRPRRRAAASFSLRNIRAISHNATLQQLGIPINTAGGVSAAAGRELETLVELVNSSHRLRKLIELAVKARLKTSIPVLRAYGTLYSPDFWVALSRHTTDENEYECHRVWESLSDGSTSLAVSRVANILSIDLRKFDHLLARLDNAPSVESRHENRLDMHALHAIRIAALMTAFRLLGKIPPISERHMLTVSQIREMGLSGDLSGAIEALETVFPIKSVNQSDQPADAGSEPSEDYGYGQIHREIILPLRATQEVLRNITLTVSHLYGAYG